MFKYEDKEIRQLEMCKTFITNEHPKLEQDTEYNPKMEMIMDRLMTDINNKVTAEGDNFGQQYI